MSKYGCYLSSLAALLLFVTQATVAERQTPSKPLRRAEIIALVGGQALPANIAHAIKARGLSFHPTDEYRADLKKIGADAVVLAALDRATAPNAPAAPDATEQQIIQNLIRAAERIQKRQFDNVVGDLAATLKAPVEVPEAGFVMGAVLREKQEWPQAIAVYREVLREDPGFPEARTKLAFVLYRAGDYDSALREVKLALTENADSAEAHKNLGLVLLGMGMLDAASAEFNEALRLKPDYGAVHFNLALVAQARRDEPGAIEELKKAVKFNPDEADYHYGLGTLLGHTDAVDNAIFELREAKRLDPTRPDIRMNLAVNLEKRDMHAAVAEFFELEKIAPDFQLCQKCLANALHVIGDDKASVQRYRKAAELDPSDPDIPLQLGGIFEEQKNYDSALAAYRKAVELADDYAPAHLALGKALLARKEYIAAIAELKKAATLAPADVPTHEALARAYRDSGDPATAMVEFKEAQTLDPNQSSAMVGLAEILEKKGDWPEAIDRYKQAAATEAAYNRSRKEGQAFIYTTDAQFQYRSAQLRLDAHIQSLKSAGKLKEIADLQSRITTVESSAGVTTQLQQLLQAGDDARGERRFPEAESSYRKAVELAEKSGSNSELLITALEDLGGMYSVRQDYAACIRFVRTTRKATRPCTVLSS